MLLKVLKLNIHYIKKVKINAANGSPNLQLVHLEK